MRTLYLKPTTPQEVHEQWGITGVPKLRLVRCNKKGVVNWKTTSLYSDREVVDWLIKGRPVVIIPS